MLRDARPIEVEPLMDGATGGGQGEVPDDGLWRDARPVSTELLDAAVEPLPDYQGMSMLPLKPLRAVLAQAGEAGLSPSTLVAGAIATGLGYFVRYRKRR